MEKGLGQLPWFLDLRLWRTQAANSTVSSINTAIAPEVEPIIVPKLGPDESIACRMVIKLELTKILIRLHEHVVNRFVFITLVTAPEIN